MLSAVFTVDRRLACNKTFVPSPPGGSNDPEPHIDQTAAVTEGSTSHAESLTIPARRRHHWISTEALSDDMAAAELFCCVVHTGWSSAVQRTVVQTGQSRCRELARRAVFRTCVSLGRGRLCKVVIEGDNKGLHVVRRAPNLARGAQTVSVE